MAGPERKRPGSSSPILLAAAMEQPRIADTAEPAADPAAAPLEHVSEAPANAPVTTDPEAASQAVSGTEPASEVSTSVPLEEPLVEPAAPAALPTSSVNAAPAPPASNPAPSAATPPAPEVPAVYIPENAKTSINMDLLTRLKLRADTAVLRTAGLPGGYRSRGQLMNAALEAELIRLEAEFNNGEEFPPNMGAFRTGRPLGS